MIMQRRRHNYDRRKLNFSEIYLSRAVPCTTNLTQTELGLNRRTRGGRLTACLPACLNYGRASKPEIPLHYT